MNRKQHRAADRLGTLIGIAVVVLIFTGVFLLL